MRCDQRHYTDIYVMLVCGRNTAVGRYTTLFFLAVGRIHIIILNQAAGRTKFDRRPDLARWPDIGHACYR